MTTVPQLTLPPPRANRATTTSKVKSSHLNGSDFKQDLLRNQNFNWRSTDYYDYDDGYAFLCAKGASPDGDSGSPMVLPSRWRSSPRASAGELKKFEEKLNANSNIFESSALSEKDSQSSPFGSTCKNTKHGTTEQELISLDLEDGYRVVLHTRVHEDGRIEKLERAIDYCTCMFCVQGIFYNFVDDEDDCNSVSSSPCSCSKPDVSCTKRWSILTLLSCFMPCLLFYPPFRGCLALCKKCRHRQRAKDGDVTVQMLKPQQRPKKATDV